MTRLRPKRRRDRPTAIQSRIASPLMHILTSRTTTEVKTAGLVSKGERARAGAWRRSLDDQDTEVALWSVYESYAHRG